MSGMNVDTLNDLQGLITLLKALDNSAVDFPAYIWRWSNRWVVNTGYAATHRRWCLEGGEVVDFDHGRKEVIAEREARTDGA